MALRSFARISLVAPAVLVMALLLRIADPSPIEALRNLVFDSFERWAPRAYQDAGVRVVDIDDESLARIGQWPWPRFEMARLLDRLHELGAAAVALDVIFAEPDRTAPKSILPIWRSLGAGDLPPDLVSRLPDPDDVLAQSVARAPVVLGIVLTDQLGAYPKPRWGVATAGGDVGHSLVAFDGSLENLPVLEAHAAGLGALNSDGDRDGVIRNVPLVFGLRGAGVYPALSVEALRVASHASTYLLQGSGASGFTSFGRDAGMNGIRIGPFAVPTDAMGRVAIYDTGSTPERTIPVWKVLDPAMDRAQIAGKIVFIGTSAAGLSDLRTTALRTLVPGVEIHAQIAEQIRLGTFLLRPNWMTGAELFWMAAIGGGLLWALRRVGPSWAAIIGLIAVSASLACSWIAFRQLGWLVDPLYPAFGVLAIYLTQSLLQFIRTEHDRRYLKGAFGRYVSPALLEQLAQDSSRLRLGGEMRDMSILFCDIRGFTSLAETMDAQELTRFVNSFLTPMTDRILAHRGTIDKYIGDCVMAFWNAPLLEPAHGEYAVRAALAMSEALVGLNANWHREAEAAGRSFNDVRIGIGIATGPCCVGNLGSEQRFDYSVLGDDVNLASRLESQTKTYGTRIIVSEATQTMLPHFAALELDRLRVKGKLRPATIFAILGDEHTATEDWFVKLAADHRAMLGAFRAQRWPEASAILDRLRARGPAETQKLYALYAERIAEFSDAALEEDWDGVIIAESK